jgi:hypothetical protein
MAVVTGFVLFMLACLMSIAIYIQGVDPHADGKHGHGDDHEGGDDMYTRIKLE